MGVWGALLQGVLSVDSGIQEGIAEGRQADKNIALADAAAADAVRRGKKEAGEAVTKGTRLAAKQRVAYTASGVDATTGTAADVQAETLSVAGLEAAEAEAAAARESFGYKAHGKAFEAQAGLSASRRNREMAGTVIGTAGSAYNEWNKGKK